jgi:hypothetical protein
MGNHFFQFSCRKNVRWHLVEMVDWCRGYGATTRSHLGLCTPPLVPPVISSGAPRQATWETSVSEGRNYGREMAGQFGLRFRLPRKSQGSFTCRKYATWDRRIYFPSEGRHAVDFFVRKIRRLRPGSNPRSWVPEASMLTTEAADGTWYWYHAYNIKKWHLCVMYKHP